MSAPGKMMGLDIGHKRTGVALSDPDRRMAFPHRVVAMDPERKWVTELKEIIQDEDVTALLVGLPLNQYGEEGQDAQKIRPIIALLRDELRLPVIEWDESYTTVEAERMLIAADLSREKRKQIIDKVAAGILLQSYLDNQKPRQEPD